MSSSHVTGLIVKSKVFFEKDRIITVFTKQFGLLSVLVKGAQSKSFRYGSSIEPLNLVSMQISKGRSFYYLQSIDVLNRFTTMKKEYNRLMFAYYCLDILLLVCVSGQANERLYDCVVTALFKIDSEYSLRTLHKWYCYHVVSIEGISDVSESDFNYHEFTRSFGSYTGVIPKLPQYIEEFEMEKESV